MSKFSEALLKIFTLGLYGRGKSSKNIKRYRKDGKIRVDKSVERSGLGMISNDSDILTGHDINNSSVESYE